MKFIERFTSTVRADISVVGGYGTVNAFWPLEHIFSTTLWAIQVTPETPLQSLEAQAAFYRRKIKVCNSLFSFSPSTYEFSITSARRSKSMGHIGYARSPPVVSWQSLSLSFSRAMETRLSSSRLLITFPPLLLYLDLEWIFHGCLWATHEHDRSSSKQASITWLAWHMETGKERTQSDIKWQTTFTLHTKDFLLPRLWRARKVLWTAFWTAYLTLWCRYTGNLFDKDMLSRRGWNSCRIGWERLKRQSPSIWGHMACLAHIRQTSILLRSGILISASQMWG